MDALKLTAMREGSSVGDVSFVEDAVRTLVEARHALAASYGYGYSILIVPVRERFEKQQVREREYILCIIHMHMLPLAHA